MSSVATRVGWLAVAVAVAAACGDDRPPPPREDEVAMPEPDPNPDPDPADPEQPNQRADASEPPMHGGQDPTPDASTQSSNGGAGTSQPSAVDPVLDSEPACSIPEPDAGTDNDGDGFSVKQGDCNDCTGQINPGAYDFPGNEVDEDCSGDPDDEPSCDTTTPDISESSPEAAARSIGICRQQQGDSWGLVSARYVLASGNGTPAERSHGLLGSFGSNVAPRAGDSMLALSSGTAREPADLDFLHPIGAQMGTSAATPDGFPLPSPSCPNAQSSLPVAHDSIGLRLVIRVPTNASRLQFDFDFYTFEFPIFICSEFNDFFAVLMDPAPLGSIASNVSFDAQNNPVSVNNGFLEVCSAQVAGGKDFACELGPDELDGTGFEGAAATGWVQTTSPAPPGTEITLTFVIWDAGDDLLDSTVLIDHFRWTVGSGLPFTERGPIIMPL